MRRVKWASNPARAGCSVNIGQRLADCVEDVEVQVILSSATGDKRYFVTPPRSLGDGHQRQPTKGGTFGDQIEDRVDNVFSREGVLPTTSRPYRCFHALSITEQYCCVLNYDAL